MQDALTSWFLLRLELERELSARSLDALEEALRAAYATARERWPGVTVSSQRFAQHLGAVVPAGEDLVACVRELRTNDLYLASACLDKEAAALRAFEQRVLPQAAKAVRRIDADARFVDDVCSDVRVKLLVADGGPPRLAFYLGKGPLVHWVQVVATRVAQSKKRAQAVRRAPADVSDMALAVLADDPEIGPLARELRGSFSEALKAALGELTTRQRNLLRLYLVEGVSAEAIGRMYRVHRATVARWIAAAREDVQAATRRRLSDAGVLGPSSFESVMEHVLSGIDLSLAPLLEDSR